MLLQSLQEAREGYLYHATSLLNLESILRHGLQPNYSGETKFGPGYSNHVGGKSFFARTEEAGLKWRSYLEDILFNEYDDPRGHVSVLLRMPDRDDVGPDDIGTGDVADSYAYNRPIDSEQIEYMDQQGLWHPLENFDEDDFETPEDDDWYHNSEGWR